MLAMSSLFSTEKDSRVAYVSSDPGFDTRPLIKHFGPDVTWRQVFRADDHELLEIPGYGRSTVNRIRVFLSENFTFSFQEILA